MNEKRIYGSTPAPEACEAKQELGRGRDSPGRLSDAECFHRARQRGQATFTLVEQDATSPRVILEWMKENIETCPAPKLYEALARALQMRDFQYRKNAD